MNTLIIGAGYVGYRLAQHLAQHNHHITAIRRHFPHPPTHPNITHLPLDITQTHQLKKIPTNIHYAIHALSTTRGTQTHKQIYLQTTQQLIQHLTPNTHLKRYLHLSSTAVYTQTDGNWVDETTPTKPTAPTNHALIQTETTLLNAHQQKKLPINIARIAAIYGPGRTHLLQKILQNKPPNQNNPHHYLNTIHIHDLIHALHKILQKAPPGQIYNITDNQPTTQTQILQWLAQQLNKPLPTTHNPQPTQKPKRPITNKRVNNQRLLTQLNHTLKYPTYKHGYPPLIKTTLTNPHNQTNQTNQTKTQQPTHKKHLHPPTKNTTLPPTTTHP